MQFPRRWVVPSAGPRQNRLAYPPLLQAALNGDRLHPRHPHSPEEIAPEAKAAVAGATERFLAERSDKAPLAASGHPTSPRYSSSSTRR